MQSPQAMSLTMERYSLTGKWLRISENYGKVLIVFDSEYITVFKSQKYALHYRCDSFSEKH